MRPAEARSEIEIEICGMLVVQVPQANIIK